MVLLLLLPLVLSANDPYEAEFQTYLVKGAFNPRLHVPAARFQNSTTISSTTMKKGKRDQYSYFRCVVELTKVTFSECFAYGAGYTFGSGGGLYLSASNLAASQCTFTKNKALIAGAISSVAGDLMISGNSIFSSNVAFKKAGAISVTYSEFGLYTEIDNVNPTGITPQEPSVSIVDTSFMNNSCQEFCGALLISRARDATISNTLFSGNQAGNAAGALWTSQTNLVISSSFFYENVCGRPFFRADNTNNRFKAKESQRNAPYRGGGAILFEMPNIENSGELTLTTISCCFAGNGFIQTYTYENISKGLDIYFLFGNRTLDATKTSAANSLWVSSGDYFKTETKEEAIGYLGGTYILYETDTQYGYNNTDAKCEGFPTTQTFTLAPTATIYVFTPAETPTGPSEEEEPEPTPAPSILPQPTSIKSEISIIPPRTNIPPTAIPVPTFPPATINPGSPIPTNQATMAITPEMTFADTPKISPENTPEATPVLTPFQSPEETIARTPDISPEVTPATTPKITGLSAEPTLELTPTHEPTRAPTPASTPNESPVNTLPMTLIETLAFTPHITPDLTPIQTIGETLSQSPIPTFEMTPLLTPINTLKPTISHTLPASYDGTPIITPEITPIMTLDVSPVETNVETPMITNDLTPIETNVETPQETPENTPIISEIETPELTIAQTHIETPFISPVDTIAVTPEGTVSMTKERTMPPRTVLSDQTIVYTHTRSIIFSASQTQIETSSSFITNISTISNDQTIIITIITYTGDITNVISQYPSLTDLPVSYFIEASTLSESTDGMSLGLLIAIIVGALLLILLAAGLIWFFIFAEREDSSSPSCAEMEEETVIQVIDSMSAPITNDNPLWTTSVMGDTDDPFRDDFEEDGAEFLTLQPDMR